MKRVLLIFCVCTFIFSCNSDDSQTQNEPETNFYALTVGNTWVYKNYRYNPQTETYDDTGVIDSISIVGTEEVFGNAYFKFRRLTTGNEEGITFCNPNGEYFELFREFEGKLIDSDNKIRFVNNDITERLLSENQWGNIYETLQDGTNSIDVESGIFQCLFSQRYARNPNGEQLAGLDHFYYADGIGLIKDTSSFVSSEIHTIERRLDSYNIQ